MLHEFVIQEPHMNLISVKYLISIIYVTSLTT